MFTRELTPPTSQNLPWNRREALLTCSRNNHPQDRWTHTGLKEEPSRAQTNTGLTWSHQDSGPERLLQIGLNGGRDPFSHFYIDQCRDGDSSWLEWFLLQQDLCVGGKFEGFWWVCQLPTLPDVGGPCTPVLHRKCSHTQRVARKRENMGQKQDDNRCMRCTLTDVNIKLYNIYLYQTTLKENEF